MQYLESDEKVCMHSFTPHAYNFVHNIMIYMYSTHFLLLLSQVPENEVDRMHVRDNLKAVTVSNL